MQCPIVAYVKEKTVRRQEVTDSGEMDHKLTPRVVIWNPQASRAREAEALRRRIACDSLSHIVEATSRAHATRIAREVKASAPPQTILVAAGGDGTVNAVLQGLIPLENAGAEQEGTLAILPLGTGNDFSRHLGIAQDPLDAWNSFDHLETRRVDLGWVRHENEGRIFCNSANYGNSSRIQRRIDSEAKKRWGALAYLGAATRVLPDLNRFEVSLRCDGQGPERFDALNVILANARTAGGGIEIAPRASLVDGLLDVIVISEADLAELASAATDFVLGDYLDRNCVTYRRAQRVSVTGRHGVPLLVDGEPFSGNTYELEVIPGAIRVLTGPGFLG